MAHVPPQGGRNRVRQPPGYPNGMVYEHLASYQTLENPKNGGVSGEIPSGYVNVYQAG